MPSCKSDIDTINEHVDQEHQDEEDEERLCHGDGEKNHHRCHQDRENLVEKEQLDLEQQMTLLRDLLRIERESNETRRQNNIGLQKYLNQLQTDYLRQQNDLAEALELSHKIKAQKDSQLAIVEETLKEKECLIEQLRTNLANLDEQNLRQEMKENLARQQKVAELEREQLKNQIESMEQQLAHERVNNSQLLQQFQQKLDDQLKLNERELNMLRERLANTQTELDRIMNEPQHLTLKALKEDKSNLESQVDGLNTIMEESKSKFECLSKRLETILLEQEQAEEKNQEELDRLQRHCAEQRKQINELKLSLDDKDEVVQVLQFNLRRSEKRVHNLIGSLKNREEIYNQMISQMKLEHEQEMEKLNNNLRSNERRLIESESNLDKKQNELTRLQLDQENQLESIRNDRDERLNKLLGEKEHQERQLQAAELRLAKEIEQSTGRQKLIEQLRKESRQFNEESKQLSIELTKCESRLHTKQQELSQTLERINQQSNNTNNESVNEQLKLERDETKRHSQKLLQFIEDLKKDNEKLTIKLRIAETNLSKMSSAIHGEHLKMKLEFEKKLEQIKEERSVFNRNKMRYKQYGYNLTKYCEHLKRAHEHLCNPRSCGYMIGPLRPD